MIIGDPLDPDSFDAEMRKAMLAYAGPNLWDEWSVVEHPICLYGYSEWSLKKFIAMFDKIPTEFFDGAAVMLNGEDTPSFIVAYQRPASREERIARIMDAYNACIRKRDHEREEYERLKKKYEGK